LDGKGHRRFLNEIIIKHIKGQRVLDLGCGTATLFEELISNNRNFSSLVGVEYSKEIADRARSKNIRNTEIVNSDITQFSFKDGVFDTVVMTSIIHEIVSFYSLEILGTLLRKAYQSLSLGGKMIIYDGFRNDDIVVKLEIKSKSKTELLREYISMRPEVIFHKAGTSILDFVHKCYYLDNWEHELKEQYYPLSLESYFLALYSAGFSTIKTHYFPEKENLLQIRKDFSITSFSGTSLGTTHCNCLFIAEKNI
jgi:ubiquinone/menaquinone biosynthesis C-methylase UbiE